MPTIRCENCGKKLSICVIPYQRIFKDEKTGKWLPNSDICICNPGDVGVFGLIRRKEAYEARERAKAEKYAHRQAN